MATKGVSIPVMGEYSYNETTGVVSYANPFIANKVAEYSVSWTTGDDNPLYLDNGIGENDKGSFQSGELTLTTGDLEQATSKKILGTTTYTDTYTVDGAEKTATVQVWDDERNSPYLGYGIIEMHQINDVTSYRAIFFPKVYFNVPEEAATTKGESIEWQTRQLPGSILRSDAVTANGAHPWMEDAWFETESDARGWLWYKCGGTTQAAANE